MSVYDYSYIAKRLREIKDEDLRERGILPSQSSPEAIDQRPADFDGWFRQLLGSLG